MIVCSPKYSSKCRFHSEPPVTLNERPGIPKRLGKSLSDSSIWDEVTSIFLSGRDHFYDSLKDMLTQRAGEIEQLLPHQWVSARSQAKRL